jgi:NAD(P)-dependent dehydrogenase (short-subunit alcohol dehydrogenase family)
MRPYWGPYAISKAGLEALARTYAAETAGTGVTVMIANPGALRTRMRAQAMPGEDPQKLRTPEEFAEKCIALLRPDWRDSARLYDFPTDRLRDFRAPD